MEIRSIKDQMIGLYGGGKTVERQDTRANTVESKESYVITGNSATNLEEEKRAWNRYDTLRNPKRDARIRFFDLVELCKKGTPAGEMAKTLEDQMVEMSMDAGASDWLTAMDFFWSAIETALPREDASTADKKEEELENMGLGTDIIPAANILTAFVIKYKGMHVDIVRKLRKKDFPDHRSIDESDSFIPGPSESSFFKLTDKADDSRSAAKYRKSLLEKIGNGVRSWISHHHGANSSVSEILDAISLCADRAAPKPKSDTTANSAKTTKSALNDTVCELITFNTSTGLFSHACRECGRKNHLTKDCYKLKPTGGGPSGNNNQKTYGGNQGGNNKTNGGNNNVSGGKDGRFGGQESGGQGTGGKFHRNNLNEKGSNTTANNNKGNRPTATGSMDAGTNGTKRKCISGDSCRFVMRTGTCNYYHTDDEKAIMTKKWREECEKERKKKVAVDEVVSEMYACDVFPDTGEEQRFKLGCGCCGNNSSVEMETALESYDVERAHFLGSCGNRDYYEVVEKDGVCAIDNGTTGEEIIQELDSTIWIRPDNAAGAIVLTGQYRRFLHNPRPADRSFQAANSSSIDAPVMGEIIGRWGSREKIDTVTVYISDTISRNLGGSEEVKKQLGLLDRTVEGYYLDIESHERIPVVEVDGKNFIGFRITALPSVTNLDNLEEHLRLGHTVPTKEKCIFCILGKAKQRSKNSGWKVQDLRKNQLAQADVGGPYPESAVGNRKYMVVIREAKTLVNCVLCLPSRKQAGAIIFRQYCKKFKAPEYYLPDGANELYKCEVLGDELIKAGTKMADPTKYDHSLHCYSEGFIQVLLMDIRTLGLDARLSARYWNLAALHSSFLRNVVKRSSWRNGDEGCGVPILDIDGNPYEANLVDRVIKYGTPSAILLPHEKIDSEAKISAIKRIIVGKFVGIGTDGYRILTEKDEIMVGRTIRIMGEQGRIFTIENDDENIETPNKIDALYGYPPGLMIDQVEIEDNQGMVNGSNNNNISSITVNNNKSTLKIDEEFAMDNKGVNQLVEEVKQGNSSGSDNGNMTKNHNMDKSNINAERSKDALHDEDNLVLVQELATAAGFDKFNIMEYQKQPMGRKTEMMKHLKVASCGPATYSDVAKWTAPGNKSLPCIESKNDKILGSGEILDKRRLIILGDRQVELDLEDFYGSLGNVAHDTTIMNLLATIVIHALRILTGDSSGAFIQSDYLQPGKEKEDIAYPVGDLPKEWRSTFGCSRVVFRKGVNGMRLSSYGWQERRNGIFINIGGLDKNIRDPSLFQQRAGQPLSFIATHVDDYLEGYESESAMKKMIEALKIEVDEGEVVGVIQGHEFRCYKFKSLEIVYCQSLKLMAIGQNRYLDKVQSKIEAEGGSRFKGDIPLSVSYPDEVLEAKNRGEETNAKHKKLQQQLGGEIGYTRTTRMEINESLRQTVSAPPYECTIKGLRKIRAYLVTRRKILVFHPNSEEKGFKTVTKTDANYAPPPDRKSISGCNVENVGMVVYSEAKKQPVIAQSTAESELIAGSEGVKHGRANEELNLSMNIKQVGVSEWCADNSAAIFINSGSGLNRGSRHIETRFLSIKERIENGQLKAVKIPGISNSSNIHTKLLHRQQFDNETALLGLHDVEFKADLEDSSAREKERRKVMMNKLITIACGDCEHMGRIIRILGRD